jgi:hypothetical protein
MSMEAMAKSSFGSLKVFASTWIVPRNAMAISVRSVFMFGFCEAALNASHPAAARRYAGFI